MAGSATLMVYFTAAKLWFNLDGMPIGYRKRLVLNELSEFIPRPYHRALPR
jgi:hypothetical protein